MVKQLFVIRKDTPHIHITNHLSMHYYDYYDYYDASKDSSIYFSDCHLKGLQLRLLRTIDADVGIRIDTLLNEK